MRIDSASGPFTVPRQLLASLHGEAGRRVIAFVGSGLSATVGLPSWEELIRRVAERLGIAADISPALDEGRLLEACEYLAIRFGEPAVQATVAAVIDGATPATSRVHSLLAEIPFHGIVTTNYDLLCTSVPGGERWGIPLHHATSGLGGRSRRPFVLHIHGHVHDAQSIVFTKAAYDRFSDAPVLPGGGFFMEAFQNACVVFLGFGFRDENIERVLRHLRRMGRELAGSAFAVLPVDAGARPDPVRTVLLERSGVVPIEVAGTNGRAAAVDWWLTSLEGVVGRGVRARAGSVTRLPYAREITAALDRLMESERDGTRADLSERLGRDDLELLFFSEPGSIELARIWEYVSAAEARQLLSRAVERSRDPAYLTALTLLPGPEA
jgi:hypothetical protein